MHSSKYSTNKLRKLLPNIWRERDVTAFLMQWVKQPLNVASITPSSNRLGALVTRDIAPDTGPILVLGPGTGVLARALLRKGVKPQDLALVELNPDFYALLRRRYTNIQIRNQDAATATLSAFGFNAPFAGVVSGLGLLSMKPEKVKQILSNCFAHMQTGGALYQFTYGWKCPVPAQVMHELDLSAEKIGTVFLNVPPASVYRITLQNQRQAIT
jgi:phosphatidylethanolamine/phosphatidyl-N-methylethanolamine N-methyltransferase